MNTKTLQTTFPVQVGWSWLVTFCLLAPWVVLSGPVQGQVLEEVIVTAQKREQSLQDVGIAITAFTGDQIDALGLENSVDVARLTSGVYISAASGGQDSQFSIRGVTQNDFNDAIEGPNAVYVDEGYMAAQNGAIFGLFDIDRVEILKGPQGTTFGRNATGGLVHFITRKPTRDFEGFADIFYGSYDQVRVEAAIGGPVSETVAGRLSVMSNQHNEIMNNVYPFGATVSGTPGGDQDFWNEDEWAVRGQFLWTPSEDIDFLVSAFGSHQKAGEAPYQSIATIAIIDAQGRHVDTVHAGPNDVCEAISAETGNCVPIVAVDGELPAFLGVPGVPPEDAVRPVPGGDLFGYIDPDGKNFDTSKDFAFKHIGDYKSHGATAKLTWDFDSVQFTSVSHYMNFKREHLLDVDATPTPQVIFQAESDSDSFTQELRLNGERDRLSWLTGLYFLNIDTTHTLGLAFPLNSPFSSPAIFGIPVEANNLVDLVTKSYSIFGQLEYNLTDNLILIAGLRAISEHKDYNYEQFFFLNLDDKKIETDSAPLFPGRAPFNDKSKESLLASKLQLEYLPTEDWMLYAGINRGVKAGSYNAKLNDGSPTLTDSEIPYGAETLMAYEAGFKSTLFNGSTRFNGAFYYYNYDDYQAYVFTNSSGYVRNADADYMGFELDLTTQPVTGLYLMLSASVIDAEIQDLEVAPNLFNDVKPTYTPTVQLAGLARYEWPSPVFGGKIAVLLDANYASSIYHNIRNFSGQKLPSYVVSNARLSWNSPDDQWEVTFSVNNIADTRYRLVGFDLSTVCGCSQEAYGKPRWFGGSIRFNFF
ncbi:MAG: TonB-dependent receptor [Candidatus Berkelbacteria bacterium]|nr:TonB-dependent receptor [Candidatus Berkelbacteria bacterium]